MADDGTGTGAPEQRMSLQDLQSILQVVFDIPGWWLAFTVALMLLSTVSISVGLHKAWSLAFQVTNTTALFMALFLFPAILRIFALAGGGFKGAGFELSGTGLLSHIRTQIGTLIEETGRADESLKQEGQPGTQRVSEQLQQLYVAATPASSPSSYRTQLEELAKRYDNIRATQRSGASRTQQMDAVVGGMRALIPEAGLTPDEIDMYLRSSEAGKRLIGMAAVQSMGGARYFDSVLRILSPKSTPFEQYHALRAMERLLPELNASDRQRLAQRLNDPELVHAVGRDSSRETIRRRLLTSLEPAR